MSETPEETAADGRLARACAAGDAAALERFAIEFADLLNRPFDAFARKLASPTLSREVFAAHVARIACQDFLAAGHVAGGDHHLRYFVERLAREDLALALACARGSDEAWKLLERTYGAYIRGLVATVAKSPSDAEEIASSVLGDLYLSRQGRGGSALAAYAGRARLSTWLRAIVHFKAADYFDSRRRTVSLTAAEFSGRDGRAARAIVVRDATPDGEADRRERLARLESAANRVLEGLVPRDRELVDAYYVRGETVESIGRRLGVHKASVSRWLKRVRQQLLGAFRRSLGPGDLDGDDETFWRSVSREFRLGSGRRISGKDRCDGSS